MEIQRENFDDSNFSEEENFKTETLFSKTKEKLIDIAKFGTILSGYLKNNPNETDWEGVIGDVLMPYAKEHNFSPNLVDSLTGTIERYFYLKQTKEEVVEPFIIEDQNGSKSIDGNELFKHFFHQQPQMDVNIIDAPTHIIFITNSLEDYASVVQESTDSVASGGIANTGGEIAYILLRNDPESLMSIDTLDHENQHIENYISNNNNLLPFHYSLRYKIHRDSIETHVTNQQVFNALVDEFKLINAFNIRNEIVAYLSEKNQVEIKDILTSNELYNYNKINPKRSNLRAQEIIANSMVTNSEGMPVSDLEEALLFVNSAYTESKNYIPQWVDSAQNIKELTQDTLTKKEMLYLLMTIPIYRWNSLEKLLIRAKKSTNTESSQVQVEDELAKELLNQ